MRPVRLRYAYELLNAYGAFDIENSTLVRPRQATDVEIGWLHTANYIAAVRNLSLGLSGYDPQPYGFGTGGDNPIYQGMYDAAMLRANGISVAEVAAQEGVVEGYAEDGLSPDDEVSR